jgi:hypothetical protein
MSVGGWVIISVVAGLLAVAFGVGPRQPVRARARRR